MPYVQINIGEGRTVDQKRALTEAVTDALVKHAGVERRWVVIHIFDVPYTNISREGWLFSDKFKTEEKEDKGK